MGVKNVFLKLFFMFSCKQFFLITEDFKMVY